jgi:hypothetical protein
MNHACVLTYCYIFVWTGGAPGGDVYRWDLRYMAGGPVLTYEAPSKQLKGGGDVRSPWP